MANDKDKTENERFMKSFYQGMVEIPHESYFTISDEAENENEKSEPKKIWRASRIKYFEKFDEYDYAEADLNISLQAKLQEALKKIMKLEKNCNKKQKRIQKLNLLRENQKCLLERLCVEQQQLIAEKDRSIESLEKKGIKMIEMMEHMQTMMYQLAQLQSVRPMEEPSSVPTHRCVQTIVELSILDQFVDEEIASIAELSCQSTQQQNDNGIFSVDHPVDDDNVVTADALLQPIKRQTDNKIVIVDSNFDVEIALPTEELQQLGSQQIANNLSIVCYNLNDEVDLLADDEFALRAEDSLQTCQQKLEDVIHIVDDATALPSPTDELNLCSVRIEMMNVQTNAVHVAPKPTERVKKKSLYTDECLDRVAFETEMPS